MNGPITMARCALAWLLAHPPPPGSLTGIYATDGLGYAAGVEL